MEEFIHYIKSLETEILQELLAQYKFEMKNRLDNHIEKIFLIEKEIKRRLR